MIKRGWNGKKGLVGEGSKEGLCVQNKEKINAIETVKCPKCKWILQNSLNYALFPIFSWNPAGSILDLLPS